jgi:kynurenine formamidase
MLVSLCKYKFLDKKLCFLLLIKLHQVIHTVKKYLTIRPRIEGCPMKVPRYQELLTRTDAPPGSAWGVFGPDDECGTLNFIDADARIRAAMLVRQGRCFNLDCALDAFAPPVAPHRHAPCHTLFSNSPHHRDDRIDNFYLQGTTQVDGLRHFRHPDYGFWNGFADERIAAGSPTLGINRYAERCIVGRGVLLDLDRYLRSQGRRLDVAGGEPFGVELLDEVAAAQGVSIERGDILMIRTGWMDHYFNVMSPADRVAVPRALRCTGLIQSERTPEWLWDHGIAVAASDNVGLEAIPSIADSPFVSQRDRAAGTDPIHAGLMHPTLIALLGLCIGELWDLEALSEACAADGRWDCLVSCKPLNLVGGVGSPANAIAIR